jgi:hypothetical protein
MSENYFQYVSEPFPHAFIPQLVEPEIYAKIKFPDLPERRDGRIGRDLYPGEQGYAELMETQGWKEFSAKFNSAEFVRSAVDLFAEDLLRQGALIDPHKIYYEPYWENRHETESHTLSETYDPNSVFVRFDLQAIGQSYNKGVHCDWPRRLFGGVLFLTDAEQEGIEGGEFGLFSDLHSDRICREPKLERSYPLVGNTGVIFLNTNNGFHGPRPIRKATGLRKWIYYSVSSRRNIWTVKPSTATMRPVQNIKADVATALQAQNKKLLPEMDRPQLEYIVTGIYKSLLKRNPDPFWLNKHCNAIEEAGFEQGIANLVRHLSSTEEFRKVVGQSATTV